MRNSFLGKVLVWGFVCGILFLVGCDQPKSKYEKTVEVSSEFGFGWTLIAKTNVGNINVTRGDSNDCNVTAKITARAQTDEEAKELGEKVKITLQPNGDTLKIKVDKPRDDKKHKVFISFDITMPKDGNLKLETNVGNIGVSGIVGVIKGVSNVGSVKCKGVCRDINAKTNVGDVKIAYASDAGEVFKVRGETNVGSINFAGPDVYSAKVNASSNVGSITTDRPLMVKGKVGKKLRGTIGDGRGRINLKTNVGSISIK